MKKIFAILFLIFFFLAPDIAYAENDFKVDAHVTYDIKEDGSTKVHYEVNLQNLKTEILAQSFKISLESGGISEAKAFSRGSELPVSVVNSDGSSTLDVSFENEPLAGKGKVRNFTIDFTEKGVTEKTGQVWEVSIPKLSNSEYFDTYDVQLKVPSSFGELAYISPDPLTNESRLGENVYSFNKNQVNSNTITAIFGEFQVFSFNLTYHLENPLKIVSKAEIAIPPDTSFQKVFYESMSPSPDNVIKDDDGNWLAEYNLSPRERVDVKVLGKVELFSSPRDLTPPNESRLGQYLGEKKYWEVNTPAIKKLAQSLKTPQNIYNYVVGALTYDYKRVNPTTDRKGALAALSSPSSAICLEFSDLFVALARAAGIPAREVNGYAYTENPSLQPLSLVADVLHAWPEYWDSNKKTWIPVDPTWGNTTGGSDFFTKFDLRHFTFVIHGGDSEKPYPPGSYKLGPNPQKDVFVSFDKPSELKKDIIDITTLVPKTFVVKSLPFIITVKNNGSTALYNKIVTISYPGGVKEQELIDFLPPFGSREIKRDLPVGLLGSRLPDGATATIDNFTKKIQIPRQTIIIINLLLITSVLLVIFLVVILTIKIKRWLKR